jgi:DNA-binding transcriptional ArsR family regulator
MTPPGEYGSTWLEQSWQPPGNKDASKKVELFVTTATRTLPHPELDEVELTAVLFALSDPARLDLVRELALRGPLTVAECHSADPSVPKSTFSHHLKTLREAGLVRNEPAGRQRTITLRREELDRRFPGLLDSVVR